MFSSLASRASMQAGRQIIRRYGSGEKFVPKTMNDMPVPKGSWQQHFDIKQRRYNGYLAGSALVLATTVYILVTTDMLIWGLPDLKKLNIK